jgi:hypothetical protein
MGFGSATSSRGAQFRARQQQQQRTKKQVRQQGKQRMKEQAKQQADSRPQPQQQLSEEAVRQEVMSHGRGIPMQLEELQRVNNLLEMAQRSGAKLPGGQALINEHVPPIHEEFERLGR